VVLVLRRGTLAGKRTKRREREEEPRKRRRGRGEMTWHPDMWDPWVPH
jgi:hypothetical protein